MVLRLQVRIRRELFVIIMSLSKRINELSCCVPPHRGIPCRLEHGDSNGDGLLGRVALSASGSRTSSRTWKRISSRSQTDAERLLVDSVHM